MSEDTKIIYYKDTDSDNVPYMIKLTISPDKATLRDFKQALNVNAKNFKFFFQQIVEDFGVVKEEICDDNMKLPFVKGRAVCWLVQVEDGLADSDSRSLTSLNTQDLNSKPVDNPENGNNFECNLRNQYPSTHSISSQGSSKSNNENVDFRSNSNTNINRNSKNMHSTNGQIYDTLHNRKSTKSRHSAVLKDLNNDDTSTDTESLINGFDDIRIHHQRPVSSLSNPLNSNGLMIGGIGNGGSGSMRRSSKPNVNINNQNPSKNGNQKRSLDSQNIAQGYINSNQNRHSTNGNFYSNYYQPMKHHPMQNQNFNSLKSGNKFRKNDFQDSFSDSDNELNNYDFDDTNDDSQNSSQAPTATTAPSIISSNLDTTTFFDTENDDDDGQFSSITENTNSTMSSSRHYGVNRNRRKMRHKLPTHHLKPNNSLHSSMTSLTDSTMSLNIITVTLKMDCVNFLGISIVGQSNKGGEGGIYVGSIMSGGAVAQDGRIEPGDMILQVNEVSFENMSNDDAVRVLREAVMKPGPVKLVVAKCWDPNPQGYFTVSKQEPIRPIDPSAWVAHTQAHTGTHPVGSNGNIYGQNMMKNQNYRLSHSVSTFGSNSSLSTSLADSTISTAYGNNMGNGNYYHQNMMGGNGLGCTTTTTNGDSTRFGNEHLNLTIKTDMETLVRAMAAADSGLDVRDRNWLKITIPNAFIGSDVVDWLFNHVEGFPDRRDARKYACDMLRFGFIRHAVNKVRFSEQCYYIFGDFSQSALNSQMMGMNGGMGMSGGNLFTLNEESEVDFDSVSELDRDTLYAPINYQQQGNYHVNNGNYQHVPKLYANLNGIGGPPPPPSYMSSSSSNATSNSTSTTSNNTTTQTIATCTTASNYMMTNNNTNSSSGLGGSNSSNGSANTANSTQQSNFSALVSHQVISNGIVNTERHTSNACQFYFPTPSAPLDGYNDMSSLSSTSHLQIQQNMNSLNTETDFDDTIPIQAAQNSQHQNTLNSLIATPISIHSNQRFNIKSRMDTKSMRSSDNSSSGNGSDVELLSSRKSKNQSKNYETPQFNTSSKSDKSNGKKQQRGIDQVPKDLRSSKQSFHQAMDNPCEFFVDVM